VAGALYDQLKIPVVYLTAHADAEILERAKLTAPSGYVLKPFDDRTLRTAIELAFDRHHRERHLIEGGQRLAAAIGSIDEAVIVIGESGQVALMNRVAEALTGWTQAEALGKPVDEVFTILNARTGAPQASPVRQSVSGRRRHRLGGRRLAAGTARRPRVHPRQRHTRARWRNASRGRMPAVSRREPARRRRALGRADHGSANRLRILGRLTAAVAQKFTSLLEIGRGRAHAARLADRLLEFGERQPAPPCNLDLNGLISGLDDLLECALGDDIALQLVLAPGAAGAKADPGRIELILMHLALSARDAAFSGQFSIQTSAVFSEDTGDGYAILTVTPPAAGRAAPSDLPALDEIVRQSEGEIRFSVEEGAVKLYLPAVS
jgi:PAS domain-containing protein